MKPGREMDALVAEKVMGWRRRTEEDTAKGDLDPELGPWFFDADGCLADVPFYSTDISAAMEAFAQMKDYRGLHWSIEWIHPWSAYPQGGWWVKADDWCGSLDPEASNLRVDVVHDDLAYAIAQAVLQAVAL